MKQAAARMGSMVTALVVTLELCVLAGCASGGGPKELNKQQSEKAADINLDLGIDYLRKDNLQQAKEKIDRALDQNPRSARGHSVAAMLYSRLGDEDQADAHFQRSIALDPKNPENKNNYAAHLCQHNRFEKGQKLALEAASDPLYKTPEVAFVNAGSCARAAGDLKTAEENFRRALGVKPRFDEALFQMADLEFRQTEYMSARAFLQRYLEVGRTNAETLWLGVRIERGLGNKAQAQYYSQRLKSEYPTATQTKELLESERNPG